MYAEIWELKQFGGNVLSCPGEGHFQSSERKNWRSEITVCPVSLNKYLPVSSRE
jgi:hypothetical protein